MMANIKEEIVDELHKPSRVHYPRRQTILKGLDDLWQMDLIEFLPYARENKGFKYILTVIDCFSKFAWVEPVKSKGGKDIVKALERILSSSGRIPENIQTDNGKEFYNAHFKQLMKSYQINHYSTFSKIKCAIVERFNRTFKGLMYRLFSLQGSYKYIGHLSRLIDKYNNTVHRTIGMKPSEVNQSNAPEILMMKRRRRQRGEPRFKEGDYVRISKNRTVFSRGFTPNWSAEIFKVVAVRRTIPYTYLLEDMSKQPIQGAFYSQELQKTKFKDVYLVERILRRKHDKVYVKWWGFPKPSWINAKDLVN